MAPSGWVQKKPASKRTRLRTRMCPRRWTLGRRPPAREFIPLCLVSSHYLIKKRLRLLHPPQLSQLRKSVATTGQYFNALLTTPHHYQNLPPGEANHANTI